MIRILCVSLATLCALSSASALAASKKKSSYQKAKKECLAAAPELKGKALQKCISHKKK